MAKKKKSRKSSNGGKPPKVGKGPRQKSFPGMEDKAVRRLDNLALSYDEVKKARMELTKQEVEAKRKVSDEMHKLNRKHYRHSNIEINIVPEGEKVQVRVRGIDLDEKEPEVQAAEDQAEVDEAEIGAEEVPDPEEIEEEESEEEDIPEAVSEL